MIDLTAQQRQILQEGASVRVTFPEIGADCVILRADVYEQLQARSDNDGLTVREVAQLIARNLREDDANDPLLDSYQDP